MNKIMIINGPNLNMLGRREPEIYGYDTIYDIEQKCIDYAANNGLEIDFRQSNSESEIIEWIHEAINYNGIIINAAAFTHSSIAIMDALKILEIPIIEIHMSNTHHREDFRQISYISKVAHGVITGFKSHGYILALEAMKEIIL